MLTDNKINVLSLFDGISAGRLALERAGHEIGVYFASEVDKFAIAVTQYRHPDTIQLGDVTKVRYKNGRLYSEKYPNGIEIEIHAVIGGSPCQGFSSQGGGLAFDDPRSKLYFEFERIKNEVNPEMWLLENVPMEQKHLNIITQRLNVTPIEINSNLFSGQSRIRHYWTNIKNVELPPDKDILLSDVLEDHTKTDPKNVFDLITDIKKSPKTGLIKVGWISNKRGWFESERRVYSINGKSPTVMAVKKPKITLDNKTWRFVTPLECERLQTFPDNYTLAPHPTFKGKVMSKTQRYKMLGNSWTVDVVAHIFSFWKR